MKKFVSMMVVAAAALALASCGGNGSGPLTGGQGSGTGTTPPPPPVTYNLTVLTSSPQMPSDGSKSPTITALVRDTNNNVVSGVAVSFQSSSGALTVTSGTTGASGTATATLGTAGDPTNRDIKVTATAGASTATVDVDVIGTKLSLSGPTSMVQGATQAFGVSLVDAGNNGIANSTVDVTSAKDNTLNPATLMTDTTGQGSFNLTAVNSGTDTITASAAGLQAAASVAISNDAFSVTSPAANASIDIGTPETVTVSWKSSGAAVSGQTISFSATRGTLSSGTATTDANGQATLTITSTTAGPSVISATGTNSVTGTNVSAQVIVNFVATTPSTISLQASPTTVSVQGTSTITATVRDAGGNLVAAQTVNFALVQDSTGGSLSAASAITNAQGVASVTYTASSTTSSTNGVEISGTLQGNSAITGTTALTVGGETVHLSLGTGGGQNLIVPYSATQYELPYSVQAVDSAGNAISDVTVSFTVESLGYGKGTLQWDGTLWVPICGVAPASNAGFCNDQGFASDQTNGIASVIAGLEACDTEDADNDGIEDNDYNKDFGTITPGQPVIFPGQVASTDSGTATTGTDGTAKVNLIYPKDHAIWVAVRLTATATVQGAQSSTSVDFWLPGIAADYNSQSVGPPGQTSPYGLNTTCASPH